MNLLRLHRHRPGAAGFTLIEIILAIGITIGLLVVVLFFYQQSTQVREQILAETEHVSVIRMFLDHFARELQTAHNDTFLIMGLTGTSNYIEFVTSTTPRNSAWTTDTAGPSADLHLIRYRWDALWEDGFTELFRDEETLVQTILPLDPAALPGEGASASNVTSTSTFVLEAIRHFQLRYWSGSEWQDSWNAWELPAGVEITVSSRSWPEEADPADYADTTYRRVIYLPQHALAAVADAASDPEEEAP
jgi:type II secretory pathway pseudopilin PulG